MSLSDLGSWASIISLILGFATGALSGSFFVYKKVSKLKIEERNKINSFWSIFSLNNTVNQNISDTND